MRNRTALCVLMAFLANLALAQDKPLYQLPYSPSLDLASMDRSADPCEDFYRYACGGWIKANPIPADQSSWDVFAKLSQDNRRFLWGLLEQAARPAGARTPVEQQIGNYFRACMNEAAVEKAGYSPIKPTLAAIAAMRSADELPALLARQHLRLGGGETFFGYGSNQDFADSTQMIGFVSAGGLGMPDRDYYLKPDAKSEEIRRKYVEHVQRMFELLGESPARARADARTVMTIETALATASLTRVDKRDPYKLFHKMSREELQQLTPAFRWDPYFDTLGGPASPIVNVTEPEFLMALDAQLKERSLDDWKTYLRWHAVHDAAPYLASPFVKADFDFYRKTLSGAEQLQPRWKRCVKYVDRDLGEALGRVFVERTFGPEVKQRTLDMTKRIEASMESEIRELPWMSAATRQMAFAKLRTLVNKVGYPDKWRDYSSVRIVPGDFVGNVTNAATFETRRQLAKIGKPVDRAEWYMSPPTVNAYYDPQLNDINFPAGVLQPPLFDPKMDAAPNYGNTGATIGHELTHGFDDSGRQFDAGGNLKDWWTPGDAKEFQERADCIVEQYSGYTIIDDIKIDGKLTLGEDIADLGGTLLAWLAWKDETRGTSLPAVDGLSPDQRFFVGMAQWACSNERPEDLRLRAVTDYHSPNRYRVNGVVANMPEFAAAFACKPGQPMVRANSCKVW